jgi:UDP-N-acetylglucosamine 2-epimerase (non-hydrolysing)
MERPEAMDSGHIVLTGLDQDAILDAVRFVIANQDVDRRSSIPAEYQVTNTSQRVVKLILGTTKLAHPWQGIVASS